MAERLNPGPASPAFGALASKATSPLSCSSSHTTTPPTSRNSSFFSLDELADDSDDEHCPTEDSTWTSNEASDEESEVEVDDPNIFARSSEHGDNTLKTETPFWFGDEPSEQVKGIIEVYARQLKIAALNAPRIRQPKLFVGTVRRQPVSNASTDDFTTLDEVSVFTREKLRFSAPMPLECTRMLLTVWNQEEGLPREIHAVKNAATRKYWLARAHGVPSYLFAMPDVQDARDEGFVFRVSCEDEPLSYAPISHRTRYDDWVPHAWLRADEDAEEESLFGPRP